MYLVTVIDLCTRMVVGWAIPRHLIGDLWIIPRISSCFCAYFQHLANAVFHQLPLTERIGVSR